MTAYGGTVRLEDTFYIRFFTYNASNDLADADSLPTVTIEEDGAGAAAMGATVTDIGTGEYRLAVIATTANGFEVGKRYNAVISATMAGQINKICLCEFEVRAPIDPIVGAVVADAGNTALTFKTNLTGGNDKFLDGFLLFTSGALAGQVKKVTDFVDATDFITVAAPGFTAAPSATDTFVFINS